MKLLAEFLQEKLGEGKIEAIFTLKEYMEYANVTNQEEEEVLQELKEKAERLLSYTASIESDEIDDLFARCNIVVAILWFGEEFKIKFAVETLVVRAINENWLVDCVTKGDK